MSTRRTGLVRVVQPELAAFENVRAAKPARLAAQRFDGLHDLRVDLARQYPVHDGHGRLVGDALALDEVRRQPRRRHRAGDGLAAAVNDHWVDPHGFEEHDVARHAVAHRRVGRIHKAAAVFDDERLAAETLDVRQRFKQRRGFGNEILHGWSGRRIAAPIILNARRPLAVAA